MNYKVQIISAILLLLLQICYQLSYTCTKLCHFVTEKAVYCVFMLCKLSLAQKYSTVLHAFSSKHNITKAIYSPIPYAVEHCFFQNLGCRQEISLACEEML